MITTVSKNGEIALPPQFMLQDGVAPGQEFEIERLEAGQYRIARREAPSDFRLVEWLRSCPVKDFFVPIPSESTDTL